MIVPGIKGKKILVTGSAGFIGFHVSMRLLDEGAEVIGIDSFVGYYDSRIKEKRNDLLKSHDKYVFYNSDISDHRELSDIFSKEKPDLVIHLAAQTGILYSAVNPWAYEKSNILGTLNVFECSTRNNVKKVLYASSSSVYGNNSKIPFSESDVTDTPISFYAASKKSCELMAFNYSVASGIPFIGFRFFTVYGLFGRPDMAVFKFSKCIVKGKKIVLNGNGKMMRDFTFVDDIVFGLMSAISRELPSGIYNLGDSNPRSTSDLILELEKHLGKKAILSYSDSFAGELMTTYADISKAKKYLGFEPKTSFEEGIKRFCEWFINNESWILELND